MAYTTINKSSDYFNTKLYTGDDTNNRQISLDWSPDLTWIKARNVAYGHTWYDRVRGIGKNISSSSTNSEGTNANGWSNSGCTTDSFTVDRGSNETLNESGRPMVAWNWLANGTGSANTDGSISSTVSANTTSGFSIVKWAGNGSAGATVGHGLGVAPSFIVIKCTNASHGWYAYHNKIDATAPEDYFIRLDTTSAKVNSNAILNDTAPTNSVFTLGSNVSANGSSLNYIAYCFAEKKGYSKFGSYTGNGNADGTFIYTGFKPAFLIAKETGNTRDWVMVDNKRPSYNVVDELLVPNSSGAEITGNSSLYIDLISNGCKIRGNNSAWNNSGGNYIYMAFAEAPLVGTNNVPCTAR